MASVSLVATIVLVRHGETDWNREHRFQGHADIPLNDAGRAQARELAEQFVDEPVSAIYTSPLRRAAETARIIAARLELEARTLEPLREIDVGAWEGLTIDQVKSRYPGRSDENWHAGWTDGETYDELAVRVLPALVELGSRHDDGLVLAITHAGPIRAALAASLGVSQDEARRRIGPLANGALLRVVVRDGELHAVD